MHHFPLILSLILTTTLYSVMSMNPLVSTLKLIGKKDRM